ncbi:hypothetical protein V3C99_001930 [Haemonchus contortus]
MFQSHHHFMRKQRSTSKRRQNAGRRRRARCCCENCDVENGCFGNCKTSGSELPRRCLIIKRTHPEDGIERTELRLVTYQKAGAKADQAHVLMEAARYLQDRADDAACDEDRGTGGRSRPISRGPSPCIRKGKRSASTSAFSATNEQSPTSASGASGISGVSEESEASKEDKESKGSKSEDRTIDQEQLRKSLENLVRYFARRADESDDREWSTITGIAERLLMDVTDCIRKNKPISHGLLCRIKGLNETAKEATLQSQENRKRKKEPKCTLGRSHMRI